MLKNSFITSFLLNETQTFKYSLSLQHIKLTKIIKSVHSLSKKTANKTASKNASNKKALNVVLTIILDLELVNMNIFM